MKSKLHPVSTGATVLVTDTLASSVLVIVQVTAWPGVGVIVEVPVASVPPQARVPVM